VKLVDASFLVDYAGGDDAAIAYLAAHDEEQFGASTIILSELYRGLLITQDMTREAAMSKYEWVEAVPFTNDAAAEAATIYAELRSNGEMINKSDIYRITRRMPRGLTSGMNPTIRDTNH
jgi:predicted nucleic acid-binding protein